jgi:hypothetical protein
VPLPLTRAPLNATESTGALLLLTGRRSVEVLKTGTFSPSRTRRSVVGGGQAKRRDLAVTDYTIPVLAEPKRSPRGDRRVTHA